TANGNQFGWLEQIKSTGEITWQKEFREIPQFENLTETQNGEIAVSGLSGKNVFLSRIKADGELLWTKDYDGVSYLGNGLCSTTEDGFVLTAGGTDSAEMSGSLRVIKTDKDGNSIWSKIFSIDKDPLSNQVFVDQSGSMMIIGAATDSGEHDGVFAMQLDGNGNKTNLKTNYWQDDVMDVVKD